MAEIDSRTLTGSGSFRCERCSYLLELADARTGLPACPQCGAQAWARAPLFTTTRGRPSEAPAGAGWLTSARSELEQPGSYLAYEDGGSVIVEPLAAGSTRIGRSLSATIRFDDPTVSRRHALIVQGEEGARLLDDRSLNGVFVNGKRVQDCPLHDGDEILIGRYTVHFLVHVAAAHSTPA